MYAANGRITRLNEEEEFQQKIDNLIKKLEVMEREKKHLLGDLRHLKLMLVQVDGIEGKFDEEDREWREFLEEFEDIIEPHELENPELMLPGQARPDIPVSWMMKKMKLKVTLRSKGRKSFR